ncbi:choice-of-anchor P family protein [Streptomyces xanthii]|uniref:DUF1906 domain-containing protein n=1 Tax=Streptomyces xanthii TaxID=2768069 RepID=A0A7H1BGU3_9ACTN|nr:choice-of-anchor P family protein [Streptomyces xanthii]QNS07948.1 DUF1906 domain-containing protein [Streptomyces xanthii]
MPATDQVTYQGRTFTVPESWDVIDLDRHPDTCVRFDRHAVYLGTPGARQDCPAKALGRTEAMLVQPAGRTREGAASTTRVTRDTTDHSYRATAPGLEITATYSGDRKDVERVLGSAGLPVSEARTVRSTGTAGKTAAAAALPEDSTSFQGKGFDRCAAPSAAQMQAWKGASPYGAVGVYIGGVNAGCGVTVDEGWMRAQYDAGWKYFPIYVGPQASADAGSCNGTCDVIDDPVADGAASARDAVQAAGALGLPAGSVLYYNMEHYDGEHGAVVTAFLESWTRTVHELGYRSGAYGSLSSLITDLVDAAQGGGYLAPDVIDFAKWDDNATTDEPRIPAALWADHQRIKQYSGDLTQSYGGVSLNIDANLLDVGAGAPQPPVQKDTQLAYTGAKTVSNGSPAELAATLTEKDGGAPVTGREVALTLGAGDAAQKCAAKTDDQGRAACTIASVQQPLNADATVPVTAEFAGDDAYKASKAEAAVSLQYVTGRAFGLSANVPLPLLSVKVDPTPDTGEVRTAAAVTKAPPCTASVSTLVLSAEALCAKVDAKTGPSTATATASVSKARVGIAGLPVVEVSGLTATATSSCTRQTGSTSLTLKIAGAVVDVPDTPDHTIDLGLARLVVNEQKKTADGIEVTAVHLTSATGIDVTIGAARSAAHNCAD